MTGLRARFRNSGLAGLSLDEALEFILGFTPARRDARQRAERLAARFKSLRAVFDASPEELSSAEGIGRNGAVLIRLLREAAALYLAERMTGADATVDIRPVIDYLAAAFSGERVERFIAVYLDAEGRVVASEALHEGTISRISVYPRKALELAFRHRAAGVIFAHNHPSGDPAPSRTDIELCKTLERAAASAGLRVHDHVIIGRGRGRHWTASNAGR